MLFRLLRAGVLLFALPGVFHAQEYRGSILGRITDPSGAVLPAATVSATNQETNVGVQVTSNPEGAYNIPFLLPGTYTMKVEAAGFKGSVRPGIVVQVNDRIEVNFALEIGSAAEAITVTAETPLLQTASADMGQVVERQMIDRLPMNSMNAMNLADMAPGVLGGSGHQMTNGQNDITINGGSGRERGNDITIDGIPNVAPRFNGLAVTVPSSDAVQEFKVQTTMFDAQNGRSNGGAISFTTRGGTNNLHGTAYYFLYDEALNANGWVRNRNGQARAPLNQKLYGGTIGGPVVIPSIAGLPGYNGKNRTFFFVSIEKQKSQNEFTRFARVPTELERKGDFSQTRSLTNTPLGVYDPLTTYIDENRRTIRLPFPNNTIPLNRQDPTGQAVMNLYALPNQDVTPRIGTFNWLGQGRFRGLVDNYMTRIDQAISEKQRFYFRYSLLNGNDERDFAMRGMYSMPSSASGYSTDEMNPRRNQSVSVDDSYSFTPTIFGSFRYGYTRTNLVAYSDGNRYSATEMKMPAIVLANQVTGGFPMIDMGENMPQFGSRWRASVNDTHSLYVTINQLKGRHTLKYGLDTRVIRWHENGPGQAQNGQFTFDTRFTRSDPTQTASQNTSGTSMAALLLGLPNDARIGYNSALSLQSWYTALYFQDDFAVTSRLKLNLGLRYELETPQTERFDRIAYGLDPNVKLPVNVPDMNLMGALQFVNVDGRGRRQGETDYNNFGPRFGFAYTVNGKTALRGGYGLFYSSGLSNISGTGAVNVNALGSQPAFNTLTRIPSSNSTDGGRTPLTTIQNPFPNGISKPTGNALGAMTEVGNSISYANPFRVLPYVQQWQLSVQRMIGWGTMADVGYVGSHTLKQLNDYNQNERSDAWLQEGTGEYDQLANPFYGIFPATSTLGGTRTIARNRFWVTYPQFNQVTVYGMNTDRALYHSAQVALRKRMAHGLMLNANYTYSKNMVYDGASLVNERHWRAVAGSDRPHILRLFGSYELPFGRKKAFLRGSPGWLNAIVGGWDVSGAFRLTSGTPLTITQRRGRPTPLYNPTLSGPVRDRLGDRLDPATGRPTNPYFDTAAFAPLPGDYVISLEPPRYSWLRGPRTNYTSFTAYKSFTISEGKRFELRVEANNAFNHPIFANPALDMDNPATFGTITSASGTRNVNISGKFRF